MQIASTRGTPLSPLQPFSNTYHIEESLVLFYGFRRAMDPPIWARREGNGRPSLDTARTRFYLRNIGNVMSPSWTDLLLAPMSGKIR